MGTRAGCFKISSRLSTVCCGTIAVPRKYLKASGHIFFTPEKQSGQINSKTAVKLSIITGEVAK